MCPGFKGPKGEPGSHGPHFPAPTGVPDPNIFRGAIDSYYERRRALEMTPISMTVVRKPLATAVDFDWFDECGDPIDQSTEAGKLRVEAQLAREKAFELERQLRDAEERRELLKEALADLRSRRSHCEGTLAWGGFDTTQMRRRIAAFDLAIEVLKTEAAK